MENTTILIIEDDVIITLYISKILKNMGLQNIYKASSAKCVYDILKTNKIDIVLSDVKIKGELDGIDIATTLQDLYNLPIIFISAYKDNEILAKASKVNFLGYLLKPFRQEELEVLINLAINKHTLLTKNENLIIDTKHSFNKEKSIIYFNDQKIKLTVKESLAFCLLTNSLNSFLSYETFESAVWFDMVVSDSGRRTFIHRLKQKLPELDLRVERNLGIGLFNK